MSANILVLFLLLELFHTGADCFLDLNEEKMDSPECHNFLKDDHLYANCSVIALAFMLNPERTGPYQSIEITSTFRSIEPITAETPFLRLHIIHASISKFNSSENNIWANYKGAYEIPPYLFYQIDLVSIFNMNLTCTNRTPVGVINRRSCTLGNLNFTGSYNSITDENILQCYDSAKILTTLMAPFDNFTQFFVSSSFENSELPLRALTKLKQIWLDDFGCVIDSFQFRMSTMSFLTAVFLPYFNDVPIRSFNVDGNEFNRIYDEMFPNIPYLLTLRLSNCSISSIDPNAFQGLSNLITLDLSHNNLKSIPEAIRNFPFLQNLNLQFNDLMLKDAFSITWPPNLKTLSVSNNPIETQYLISLNSTSNLEILDLSSCKITEIIEDTFPSMTSLLRLDLSRNKLVKVSTSVFQNLPNLKYLDLSTNHLSAFYHNSKAVLEHLVFLNLSNNNLIGSEKRLPFQFVWNSLQTVDLSKNQLSSWNSSLFENLTQLRFLDLTYNNISWLNPSMQRSFDVINVSALRLSNNGFDCDSCDLISFQEWLQDNVGKLQDRPEDYLCRFPKEKYQQPLMEAVLNSDKCLPISFQWMNNVVIPVMASFVFIFILGSVLYYYRGEIYYLNLFISSKIRHYNNDLDFQNDYRYDAFVSYAEEDEQWITNYMIPEMENHEPFFQLFIRERDFLGGVAMVDAIPEAMDNCRKCIFLISNNFLNDEFRKYEVEIALQKLKDNYRDVIILVRLDQIPVTQLPKILQPIMAWKTYLDWPQDPQDQQGRRIFWNKLREAFGARLNPTVENYF